MSETLHDPAAAPAAHEETVSGVGHAHPSDGEYVKVAIFLAVITGAEIALPVRFGHSELWVIIVLLVMMVVKFSAVVMWFMHLRFDSAMFRRLFVGGLLLAVLVYLATLASFQFFGSEGDTVDERRPGGAGQLEGE
jgi:cytochrome c oxidase subunit IV